MKKLLFIIASIGCIKVHATNTPEHPESKKRIRKNLIEVGGSAAFFFNRQPMSYQSDGWLAWLPIRMEISSPFIPSYIKFGRRINNKTLVSISSYSFGDIYYNVFLRIGKNEAKPGEVMRRFFSDITISSGFSILDKKISKQISINVTLSPGVSYRWGEEQVYLSQNAFGDVIITCGCRYNSIGLGTGTNVDVVVGNRVYIGGFLGYTHYFEKSRLPKDDPDYIDSYRPNRDVLRLHPKIGVLF